MNSIAVSGILILFFFITNDCPETINAYTTYEIKQNERPFDDSKIDHIPDADGYAWLNIFYDMIPNIYAKNKKSDSMRIKRCPKCKTKFMTREEFEICPDCRKSIVGV